MLMYAAEDSNVKVLRLMRRVVFKCWCGFVKYGGSASCVALIRQRALLRPAPIADIATAARVCCVTVLTYIPVPYVRREEEFKRVMMARRLLSQSVLGGVFGRWIAFTEQCYVRATCNSMIVCRAVSPSCTRLLAHTADHPACVVMSLSLLTIRIRLC